MRVRAWRTVRSLDGLGRSLQIVQRRHAEDQGYVYDDKDRVKTILPPGVSTASSALAYQYLYDGDNNITKKFIPDMGWTELLYDARNLLTASQDSNLIYENKWLSTIYDDYGRVLQTGFNENTPNPNAPAISHLLTETFYDDACGQTAAIYTGKVCKTRTRILNSNNWLEDKNTYDPFGRLIYTQGNNHLNLTIGSETDSLYYDYADNITRIRREHQAFGNTQTLVERSLYDHAGRIENTYHKYNTEPEEWLSNHAYSIKDELAQKRLGLASLNSPLQQIDYAYLENRFLESITSPLFELFIKYDQAVPDINSTPQKNGNISSLAWQVAGQDIQANSFNYDYLNRLTQSRSATHNGTSLQLDNHYGTNYSYDARGNILSLHRNGWISSANYNQIDSLDYDYYTSSNRLKTLADLTQGTGLAKGFQPGTGGDYLYDENGNLVYDPHKDLSIHYNHLNLPDSITKANGDKIIWIYDATGVKLQKQVTQTVTGTMVINDNPIASGLYQALSIQSAGVVPTGNTVTFKAGQQICLGSGFKATGLFKGIIGTPGPTVTTQDYCSGIEYRNGSLEAIYHAEGRLYFEGGNSRYEYVLLDHLGNQRLTFTDSSGVAKILEENHYYPFGMRMEGDYIQNAGRENRYLYNGKELDTDFGLNWYHYGARMYDPAVGRFTGVDPIADRFAHLSTFNYASNNPISNVDLHGLQGVHFQVLATTDAARNPSGVGAHYLGFVNGATNALQGTYDALTTNPIQTAKGIWAAVTHPKQTLSAIKDGVSGTAEDLISGSGVERGEAIFEVASLVVSYTKASKLSLVDDALNPLGAKRRFSKNDRQKGFEKSKDDDGVPRCEYCDEELDSNYGNSNSYEADHRDPWVKGGQSEQSNLAPSCRTCNRSKGKKELGTEWIPPKDRNE